ncbi:hypothetical protein [Variovorax sp. LT1R16]|uniref:hypothetical protein n=1 Tax=Variovorax sp. LT1R16 TaxID=3443728 RepID=UPI003F47CB89
MSVGDLTNAAEWIRARIVGDGTESNPGEGALSKIAMGWAVGNSASAQGALASTTLAVAGVLRAGSLVAGAVFSTRALGSQARQKELFDLFSKEERGNSISLNGKAYTATPEGNRAGTTKVFNTSNLSDAQLEAQARAYVNDFINGAVLTPVSGNPPNVWSARMADGTIVNLRSVSTSNISRWTIEVKGNAQLGALNPSNRANNYEIKLK